MSTSSTILVPASPRRVSSKAKSHYRNAARSFLVRDYASAAEALDEAFDALPVSTGADGAWLDALEQQRPLEDDRETRRKCEILRITFIATVLSSSPTPSLPTELKHISTFLQLEDKKSVIQALWRCLITITEGQGDILPTPLASDLHPSLATALSLAALKLQQPLQARLVCEAYFGSVSERIDTLVEAELEQSPGAANDMSSSMTLARPEGKDKDSLASAWLRLHDLFVLHVLPELGENDAAGDFVRGQARENGGFVPDSRVENTLKQLGEMQLSKSAYLDRQQDRERERQRQLSMPTPISSAANSPAPKRKNTPRASKGKGKGVTAPDTSSTSAGNGNSTSGSSESNPSSPSRKTRSLAPTPSTRNIDQPTGFAALRGQLSSFLSNSHSTNALESDRTPFLAWLRELDPLKLLSTLCFAFAFLAYLRRMRLQGGIRRGLRERALRVVAKVGETVKMGTKVTQL